MELKLGPRFVKDPINTTTDNGTEVHIRAGVIITVKNSTSTPSSIKVTDGDATYYIKMEDFQQDVAPHLH